jgi:hypothetical protein
MTAPRTTIAGIAIARQRARPGGAARGPRRQYNVLESPFDTLTAEQGDAVIRNKPEPAHEGIRPSVIQAQVCHRTMLTS